MTTQTKFFRDCTLKFLEKTFALEQVDSLPALDAWLTMPIEISPFEHQSLEHLRSVLIFNVHDWNEPELDSHFIGPMFTLVNFSSKKFNHYVQREISGNIGEWHLYGKPDGIVASGRREPEQPFFAFQEYKRKLDPNGDPAGQVLAAMLAGQSQNPVGQPVYGCYVVGNAWYFLVLNGSKYAISSDFSALTDEIAAIFRILKTLRQLVQALTM